MDGLLLQRYPLRECRADMAIAGQVVDEVNEADPHVCRVIVLRFARLPNKSRLTFVPKCRAHLLLCGHHLKVSYHPQTATISGLSDAPARAGAVNQSCNCV